MFTHPLRLAFPQRPFVMRSVLGSERQRSVAIPTQAVLLPVRVGGRERDRVLWVQEMSRCSPEMSGGCAKGRQKSGSACRRRWQRLSRARRGLLHAGEMSSTGQQTALQVTVAVVHVFPAVLRLETSTIPRLRPRCTIFGANVTGSSDGHGRRYEM